MPKSRNNRKKKHHAAAALPNSRRGVSLQAKPAGLPSLGLPADKLALLNSLDNFSGLRNGLRKIAEMTEEWAGIPMPLDGERLIIEPTYPKAKELANIGRKEVSDDEGADIINQWWSRQDRCVIILWREKSGKLDWGKVPAFHGLDYNLRTLMCSDAWGIEQEGNAVQTLGTLINHRQFRQYMLTGMFLETSKRSKVTYMFRRLKPTVAIRSDTVKDRMRILCCLCMHPIAYYSESWAGAMCPTDDVIAHLMLMRGDEPMYWKRSNQHPPYRPESGL